MYKKFQKTIDVYQQISILKVQAFQ